MVRPRRVQRGELPPPPPGWEERARPLEVPEIPARRESNARKIWNQFKGWFTKEEEEEEARKAERKVVTTQVTYSGDNPQAMRFVIIIILLAIL